MTEYFKFNGDNHRIDNGGNHFVNGKCVNPKEYEGEIGDTYPTEDDVVDPAITITGFVPYTIKLDKNGKQVFVVTK